ncbi:hypothetical protein JCM5296_000674 [Sporobolomyces johnsonii]
MLKPLSLPGTSSKSKGGYHALNEPHKEHTVSAGGIRETEIELGDLGNDAFYDEVASIRDAIRTFETTLTQLQTKQTYSLSLAEPSEEVSISLSQLTSQLAADSTSHKNRIAALGGQVGSDEARRGHWENLKAALGRAVERWQRIEMGQREKVKERVARQYRIGKFAGSRNPFLPSSDAMRRPLISRSANECGRSITATQLTCHLQVLSTSSTSSAPQIFQQALAGPPRTTDALSALHEAKARRSELVAIEGTLVELAALTQQIADLVAEQDTKFVALETTGNAIEGDLEKGAGQVSAAKVSAAAARHKRKLCAAFGLIVLVVLAIVIAVEVKSAAGGSGGEVTKTKTATSGSATSASATATQSGTKSEVATTSAKSEAATLSSAAAARW